MKRIATWEKALDQFLAESENLIFGWGVHDCCLIAADAVLAITGVDIASDFRGKYSTQLGAMQAIKTATGASTVEDAVAWCAAKFGLVEWKSPLCAQRGDAVLISNGSDFIGGFVHLNGRHVVSIGEKGLIRLPITSVKRAWKV